MNDLEVLGLVATLPNPLHRRSHLIALTDEGSRRLVARRRLVALRAHQDAGLARLAARLSAEDADATLRVLSALVAHLRGRADSARCG